MVSLFRRLICHCSLTRRFMQLSIQHWSSGAHHCNNQKLSNDVNCPRDILMRNVSCLRQNMLFLSEDSSLIFPILILLTKTLQSSNKISYASFVHLSISHANDKEAIYTRRKRGLIPVFFSFCLMRHRELHFFHYSFNATSRFLFARQYHESATV